MKRKLLIMLTVLTVLVLTAATAVCWFYCDNRFRVEVTLCGPEEVTLVYGTPYEEAGAQARVQGTRLQQEPRRIPVETEGEVDTQRVGTYELRYRARYEDGVGEAVRLVHVVDVTKPEILLFSQAGSFTFPNTPYAEEGFQAMDDYDGDLTDQVIREEKDGMVTYTVADSSGNQQTVTREIHYDDPTPPELTLTGGPVTALYRGEAYEDPGYQALDNCDGDITAKVQITGTVDTEQEGSYVLSYSVADSYGNIAEASRTVVVSHPQPSLPENPVGGVVYLTFDDGPSVHTDRLLDILAKYQVKATFFVVDTPYIGKVARIYQEGHTVALHTATHVFSQVYAGDQAYFDDLAAISDTVEGYTGEKSWIVRFPGGSSNTISKAYCKGIMTRVTREVENRGYRYFDWNVDSVDAGGAKTSDEVFYNVIYGLSKNTSSVVLQHDLHGFSVDAVERIIQWGLANGYTFAPITAETPECHHEVAN